MLQTCTLILWFLFHPVHVTLTSIDLVPGTDSLKVFVRMYFDDFLLDYQLDEKRTVISESDPVPQYLMTGYLKEKVKIFMDNKLLEGKLLNMDLMDNEISINMLYRSVRNPRSIRVQNEIMAGLYNDQANMVIVRIGGLEEGFKLTPGQTEMSIKLDQKKGIRNRR